MSPMEADCSVLIAAGWGGHDRRMIPSNWQRIKGPDEIPGTPKIRNQGRRVSDELPQWTKNGRSLPLDKWQHRRALYLARKQSA